MRTRPRHDRRRRLATVMTAVLTGASLTVLAPTGADAAWVTPGSGGASGAGGSIGAADAPATTVAGETVSLSWTPVDLLGGLLQTTRATLVGYRQDGSTWEGPFSLGAACTDTTATSCTHTQGIGETWRYAVIAGLSGWTGPQGAEGDAVTVTPPPTGLVTFPGGGAVNAAGWDAACASGAGVCGSATPADDGAAITRVEVRITDPTGRALDDEGEWVVDPEGEVWRTALDRTPAAAGSPAPYDWFLALPASTLTGRPDGTYTVAVRVGDAAGWDAVAGTSGSVLVDRIAPVTTSDAPSGTQDAAVTVTFTATDETGGSGVATTEYRISTDGGDSFTAWTTGTSVTLDESATYTVEFRSTDVAGNVESAKTATVTVFIDVSPPTVTLTAPADATTVLSRDAVTLSATASHPTFAIVSVQFAWSRDGSSWTAIGDPVTTPVAGVYSLTTTSPHLPAGELQLRATATHTGGISGDSSPRTITVRPEIVSVVLENAGTAGTAEQGDRVVITFTDALDPGSVCSSFSASSGSQSHSDLTVQITGNPNVLTITDTGGCGTSGFGSLTLGSGGNRYTNQTLAFSGSTLTWDADARELRLTLGERTGTVRTGVTAHDTIYTPGALTAGTVGLPAGTFTATGQRF